MKLLTPLLAFALVPCAFAQFENMDSMSKAAPVDMNFAKVASNSNMFEIMSSRHALMHGRSAFVKAYAKMMIAEHTKAQGDLKKAGAMAGMMVKDKLMPKEEMVVMKLSRLRGSTFDREYIKAQMAGHKATLMKVKTYLGKGKSEPLLAYARATEPVVVKHIQMLRAKKVMKMAM